MGVAFSGNVIRRRVAVNSSAGNIIRRGIAVSIFSADGIKWGIAVAAFSDKVTRWEAMSVTFSADIIRWEDGGVTIADNVARRGIMVGGFVSDVISRQVGGYGFLRGWLCVLVLEFLADGASFCVVVRI